MNRREKYQRDLDYQTFEKALRWITDKLVDIEEKIEGLEKSMKESSEVPDV